MNRISFRIQGGGWRTYGSRISFFFRPAPLSGQASERVRVISIARLWTSPSLHLRPIDVIVSDDPYYRKSYLEGGFVLRCFQHLSLPDAATRRCSWRNNRHTGGLSNTVLSY